MGGVSVVLGAGSGYSQGFQEGWRCAGLAGLA